MKNPPTANCHIYPCKQPPTDPSGYAVQGVGLQQLACWDFKFKSRLGAWMSVSCEWLVFSGIGLCVRFIIRPAETYQALCV